MDQEESIDQVPIVAVTTLVVGVVVLVVKLIQPILSPNIQTFPWKSNTNTKQQQQHQQQQQKENRIVLLAGSYNPPHRGHLAMLEYLSQQYTHVIAVVGFNPNKKYLVTPEQRATLLRTMIQESAIAKANVRVEVVDGYIWRFAKRIGATLFVRGIRSWDKDGSDERQLQILNTWGPLLLGPLVWPIPTMYLEGNPKYNHISSSLIRSLCSTTVGDNDNRNDNNNINTTNTSASKEMLRDLVPASIVDKVAECYSA